MRRYGLEQWFSNLKFAKALLPSLLENTDSKAVTGRFGAEGVGWGLEKSFQEHTPGDSSTDVSGPTNGGYFLGKLDNTLLRRERIPASPCSTLQSSQLQRSWTPRMVMGRQGQSHPSLPALSDSAS